MPRRRLSAQDGQSGRRLVTISFIVVLCTWKMVYLQRCVCLVPDFRLHDDDESWLFGRLVYGSKMSEWRAVG